VDTSAWSLALRRKSPNEVSREPAELIKGNLYTTDLDFQDYARHPPIRLLD
jgi:hypothetical protein